MFGFKKKKDSLFNFLFNTKKMQKESTRKDELLINQIITFFKDFKQQDTQYKMVMILRIISWIIIISLALCGLIFKITRKI